MNRFTFIGKLSKPKDNFIRSFDGGFEKMSLIIKSDDGLNSAFCTLPKYGIKKGEKYIKVFDVNVQNKKKLEIPVEERFDERILKEVSSISKFRTNIGNEGKVLEFLTKEDLFNYLKPIIEEKDDLRVQVDGTVRFSEYKGNYYYDFEIKDIFENKTKESAFTLDMELFYGQNAVDETDKEQEVLISSYIEEYSYKHGDKRFYPVLLQFNTSKLDFNNPKHKDRYDYTIQDFNVEEDKIYKMRWLLKYVRGAEKQEVQFEDLSEFQQREIKLGRLDIKDCAEYVLGESKQVVRILKPISTGVWKNGRIETGFTFEEFQDKIYQPIVEQAQKKETFDDLLKEQGITDKEDDIFADDFDDLIS